MHHSSDHKIRLKNSHVLQLLHFCIKQILLRLTILLCVTNVSSNRFITKPFWHRSIEIKTLRKKISNFFLKQRSKLINADTTELSRSNYSITQAEASRLGNEALEFVSCMDQLAFKNNLLYMGLFSHSSEGFYNGLCIKVRLQTLNAVHYNQCLCKY